MSKVNFGRRCRAAKSIDPRSSLIRTILARALLEALRRFPWRASRAANIDSNLLLGGAARDAVGVSAQLDGQPME